MSGRRLAGPQQDGDWARGGRVVDMDGHEAAFIVVGVIIRYWLAPAGVVANNTNGSLLFHDFDSTMKDLKLS